MTDAEFLAAEEYEIPLVDFRARFGAPEAAPSVAVQDPQVD